MGYIIIELSGLNNLRLYEVNYGDHKDYLFGNDAVDVIKTLRELNGSDDSSKREIRQVSSVEGRVVIPKKLLGISTKERDIDHLERFIAMEYDGLPGPDVG